MTDLKKIPTGARKKKPKSPRGGSINLLGVFVVIAITLAGCAKSVPSPWKEMGVPAEHLIEVFGGTDSKQFAGAYNQDPRGVAEAFTVGLKQSGVDACGQWFEEPNGGVTAFFRKDARLWKLTSIKSSEERTPTMLVAVEGHQSEDRVLPGSDGHVVPKELLDKASSMLK